MGGQYAAKAWMACLNPCGPDVVSAKQFRACKENFKPIDINTRFPHSMIFRISSEPKPRRSKGCACCCFAMTAILFQYILFYSHSTTERNNCMRKQQEQLPRTTMLTCFSTCYSGGASGQRSGRAGPKPRVPVYCCMDSLTTI